MIKILTGSYLEYTYIFGQVTARNDNHISNESLYLYQFYDEAGKYNQK